MKRPNIIIMYADDLGFGDVGCYGAKDIPTPNLDRLAAEGIRFHQGYASAATCTPSRYSLLTGAYPFRNPRAAILPGDAPILIEPGSPTLPSMLKKAGYKTGVVGKWHLGLGNNDLDWNKDISRTPNDVGFDYSFLMPATNDRVPCVYLENRTVLDLDPDDPIDVTYNWDEAYEGVPTGRHNPELLRMKHSHGHDGTIVNGVGRIGHMRGGKAALWEDETMAEVFVEKAVEFVSRCEDQPFFLYYALHQPHVPRLPNPRFKGATPHGPRGDVIVEMDWCVGQMMEALEKLGIRDDTIFVFSSDNGPVLDDGYQDKAEELKGSHPPAGPLRGGKYSLYDGGMRVPFILSYPAAVEPGESDAMVCHTDFYASFAALVGVKMEDGEAPDSENYIDAFLGKSDAGRTELVLQGVRTKDIFRRENWTFIPPYQGPAISKSTNTELGNSSEPQLYDLSQDIGQIRNLAAERPEMVEEMSSRLNELRSQGQTR